MPDGSFIKYLLDNPYAQQALIMFGIALAFIGLSHLFRILNTKK